jgi:hypothetical protein
VVVGVFENAPETSKRVAESLGAPSEQEEDDELQMGMHQC